MAFRDLGEFLAEEPVVLPIRGREFTFPGSVSARTGLMLRHLVRVADAAKSGDVDEDSPGLTDVQEDALYDELLGDQKDALIEYATAPEYAAVCRVLVQFHLYGRAVAEHLWNAQGEASAPNRKTRRSTPKAKSTRSRGSQGGSTSSKTTAPKPADQPGSTSSTAGA